MRLASSLARTALSRAGTLSLVPTHSPSSLAFLARRLCTENNDPEQRDSSKSEGHDAGPNQSPENNSSAPKRSRYEGYYVERHADPSRSSGFFSSDNNNGQDLDSKKPASADNAERTSGSERKPGDSADGSSGRSTGEDSGGAGTSGAHTSWERLLPYVFGGGVFASYLWFARRSSTDGNNSASTSSQSNNTAIPESREVSWKVFRNEALAKRKVSKIEVVNGQTANVYFFDDLFRPKMRFNIGSVESLERKLEQAQEDLGIEPHEYVPVVYSEETPLSRMLIDWVPSLGFVAMYAFLARRMSSGFGPGAGRGSSGGSGGNSSSRSPFSSGFGGMRSGSGPFGGGGGPGGGIFNVGKANATVLNADNNKVDISFKDVAGLTEAKEEIMEFVQYLKKPDKYKELGAKIPKGALMHGPPGTGKTLLAKATAGEAGVPFLTMSGSDFMEMFVGVGPSRVRDLFSQARSLSPCIIFLDEIDAIGRKRGRGGFIGGNDERENTLNQLLVEMDGFATNSGVVVLAGTNRVDVLDPALLRPGRFDRQIVIDHPDIAGRREIFNVHLRKIQVAEPPGKDEVAKVMSTRTPGFAGADIANVCNEAALIAARSKKEAVEVVDFDAAVDRVIGGLEKKNLVMSPEEKRTVAFHEAGHAVAGWFLEHAMPLLKVSIIPRGSAALGYAQYQPVERYLVSKEALLDQMCMTLAGRASEEIFFDSVTTGAADDFNKVTRMAYQSVSEWGLGETIGNLAFPDGNGGDGEDGGFYRPYSDRTARRIDEEVRDIVASAYDRTKQLLQDKKTDVEAVALLLLEREAIGAEDMTQLLGARPWGPELRTFDAIVEDAKRAVDGDNEGGGEEAASQRTKESA